ncbi:hypothetical protein [Flavobacterium sp. H122]|uniref:hypothetical protein n=1 Tax=Flavobacterium sp. H122 TaxID=2529860 RepID=UPI0010A9AAE9|nr:hypothetical protein [Flavobacterium sp. H122]
MTQNPDITANNIVDKIVNEVKTYSDYTRYYLDIEQSWCHAEIFVNDIPAYNNFEDELIASTESINHLILKSGLQKVTYKLYPVGEHEGEIIPTLTNDTEMKITAEWQDFYKHEKQGEAGVQSTPMSKPVNPMEEPISLLSGKKYYENSFTFNAVVPYELKGWSESQDLRKLDQKELEKRVLAEFEKYRSIYQSKNLDAIAKIKFDGLRNQYVSEYATRKDIQEGWEETVNVVNSPEFEMQPIEDYKMVFYAEGRLVGLVSTSNDKNLKGNSVLVCHYKNKKGNLRGFYFGCFLHIPNGKTELETAI